MPRSSKMAEDKLLPWIRKRIPDCLHAGFIFALSENGTTSATGFPRLRRIRVSPCSTSVIKSEAFLRKSVNAMFFIGVPPKLDTQVYSLGVVFCQDSILGSTAKLSGGTNLLDCGASLAGEVTTASAYYWPRANQGANRVWTDLFWLDGTIFNGTFVTVIPSAPACLLKRSDETRETAM